MKQRVGIYLRVSTNEQSTEVQERDLLQYIKTRGWELVGTYEDKASGTNNNRPMLNNLISDARKRKFDIVLCWKLDRFFRSLKDLVNTLQELNDYGVQFVSYKDNVDMTTASGKLMTQILGAFSEFEASLIRERVVAGLKNAKAKGTVLGRPRTHVDKESILELREQGLSIRNIAIKLNLSNGMVQRVVERWKG